MPPAVTVPEVGVRDLPIALGAGDAWLRYPYPLTEEDYEELLASLRRLRRRFVQPPAFAVGVVVQWTSQGVDQFDPPKRVTSCNATHVFVEGSGTGLPIEQVKLATATE